MSVVVVGTRKKGTDMATSPGEGPVIIPVKDVETADNFENDVYSAFVKRSTQYFTSNESADHVLDACCDRNSLHMAHPPVVISGGPGF